MVANQLNDKMIRAGEALVRRLDARDVNLRSALWLYSPELEEWKLLLAVPAVADEGPRGVYQQIQHALSESGSEVDGLSLSNIRVLKPDAPLISLLRKAIHTGPGISGIRFTNNVINGIVIEDAYIYRVA